MYAMVMGLLLSACQKDGYLYRDVSSRIWLGTGLTRDASTGLYTAVDSSESSFGFYPVSREKDTLYIYANVTGETKSVPRTFEMEVIPAQTNVATSDYVIGPLVIPANSFTGKIPVIVNKNVPGLNLKKQKARLSLLFKPNEHFLNAGGGLDTFRIVWSNFLTKPAAWSNIESYNGQIFVGPFSQAKYKFILDYFGKVNFDSFYQNYQLLTGLQAALRKLLRDYNLDPANQGRPEGWPYLNDNGTPLTF